MQRFEKRGIADNEHRLYVEGDARGELGRSVGIEWNGKNSAQHAAVENGDPVGAVFSPQDYAVAGGDVARDEQRCEAPCQAGDLCVAGCLAPVACVADDGVLAANAAEVVK